MHLWFWGVEFIRFDHSARRFLWVRFSMLCMTAWCVGVSGFGLSNIYFKCDNTLTAEQLGHASSKNHLHRYGPCMSGLPFFLFSVCLDVFCFCFLHACVRVCVFPSFLLSSRSVVTLFVASSPSCLLVHTNWACIWLLMHIYTYSLIRVQYVQLFLKAILVYIE